MLDYFRGDGERPKFLAGAVKAALGVGAIGYLVARSLSAEAFDYKELSRLATTVARKLPDPLMTGSVVQSARATRLDPCVAPPRKS